MKILVTRPQIDSLKLAKQLKSHNHQTIIQPLFAVKKLPQLSPLTNQEIQAILISSAHAVFALKKLAIKKSVLILAIGKKTAQTIKDLGYKNVISANNSADSLLKLAIKKLSADNGLVIYLCGEIITLDLTAQLQQKKFLTEKIVVYKTNPTKKLNEETIQAIKNHEIDAALIYSENSALIFYQLLKQHNLLEYLGQIKLLCLSKKILNYTTTLGFSSNGLINTL